MSVLPPHRMGQQILRTSPMNHSSHSNNEIHPSEPASLNPSHAPFSGGSSNYPRIPRPSELFHSGPPFGIRPTSHPVAKPAAPMVIPHGLGSGRPAVPTETPVEPVHVPSMAPNAPAGPLGGSPLPSPFSSPAAQELAPHAPSPPWWQQVWQQGRRLMSQRSQHLTLGDPSLLPSSVAHARAQQELTRDLTAIVIAVVARYSGVEAADLQNSEGLHLWIGQHLQPLTHQTPEWMQFLTLVGAKKMQRYLQLTPVSPPVATPLDPSVPMTFDPSPSPTSPETLDTAERDASTNTSPEVVENTEIPKENPTVVVDSDDTLPVSHTGHPHHVHFPSLPSPADEAAPADESSHVVGVDDTTTPPRAPKRKRTPTPRPPRTVDLTKPPVTTKPPVKRPRPLTVPVPNPLDAPSKIPKIPKIPKPRAPRPSRSKDKPNAEEIPNPVVALPSDTSADPEALPRVPVP